MSRVPVFVSFDVEHDAELHERLVAQSRAPGSNFDVTGASESFSATDAWTDRVRRRIREIEQVIVICGERTEVALGVVSELRIAQESEREYFLLWGRRECMCTRPAGAGPNDRMYSWTNMTLHDQIEVRVRKAASDAATRTRIESRPA